MSQATPYAAYRQTQVGTANQVRMIVMLHDGAIRFLQQTLVAMSNRDYAAQSSSLNKALDIIMHLWGSLNRTPGDEISDNLAQLFQYMQARLVQANIDDNPAPIEEAIGYFRSLREAWEQVERFGANQKPQATEPRDLPELSRAA